MPRGSLRCLRKKYSSHQRLKRGYLSSPNGASASRLTRWKCARVLLEAVVRRQVHAAAEPGTGSRPSGSAASMRTFMCTVGTYGLRGCSTSETPSASNGAPASSGRCCVADGGSVAPFTWLKLQPPRSSSCAAFDQARQAVALELAAGFARPARRHERLVRPRPAARRGCGPAGPAGRRAPRATSSVCIIVRSAQRIGAAPAADGDRARPATGAARPAPVSAADGRPLSIRKYSMPTSRRPKSRNTRPTGTWRLQRHVVEARAPAVGGGRACLRAPARATGSGARRGPPATRAPSARRRRSATLRSTGTPPTQRSQRPNSGHPEQRSPCPRTSPGCRCPTWRGCRRRSPSWRCADTRSRRPASPAARRSSSFQPASRSSAARPGAAAQLHRALSSAAPTHHRLIARWPMSRAVLRAVEVDALEHLVGARLRQLDRVAQRGDAQHPAAGRADLPVAAASCRRGTPRHRALSRGRSSIASPLRGAIG